MASYEALYGWKCRTPLHWDEVGDRAVLGPDIVVNTVDLVAKIRNRMLSAQSRQKSYADLKQTDLEFTVGDLVFLKVSPMKGWTPDLSYEEVPKQILDHQVQKLRNKEIRMVKVLWGNQLTEEAMWESELDMRNRYPELFGKSNFEDEIFFKGGRIVRPQERN
ncbi:uncharacterized protein LOC121986640 [Zingiber officinale]|uniref:uncharacterized protein LOC121986640 n=1 Tax=Zingiber officinale TaxID=94328 RepID=UPI001C4DA0AE|nr:uncharacterized protein LOC121986640 [Zingiber officinale]